MNARTVRLAICTVSSCYLLAASGFAGALNASPHEVKLSAVVFGNSDAESRLELTWGHEDFHDNEYFSKWVVSRARPATMEFDLPDNASEFEIQTEGGDLTGYRLTIEIDGKLAITCKFKAEPGGVTEFVNHGVVFTQRSSEVNRTGEGNLRVRFDKAPNPGAIPMKP